MPPLHYIPVMHRDEELTEALLSEAKNRLHNDMRMEAFAEAIDMLQWKTHNLKIEICDLHAEIHDLQTKIHDLRSYVSSEKFHKDEYVYVGDVLLRLQ